MVAAELAKLVMAFPRQHPGVGAGIIAESYLAAVGDAPAWAVHTARLKIIRGEELGSGNAAFAPSPPEFARIVREIIRPLKEDLADLEALAEIECDAAPEVKERVVAGFDALQAQMKPDLAALSDAIAPGDGPYVRALRQETKGD